MQKSDIFQQHDETYRSQIAEIDFAFVQYILGLSKKGNEFFLRFFGRDYRLSKDGITDDSGEKPSYGITVILSKYLILCPPFLHEDAEWAAFRDFKKTSSFVNVNYFISDTEKVLTETFSGNLEELHQASQKLGGIPGNENLSYDLIMQFQALPRISLLLLFNEGDDDFPAYSTVFFQRQAEYYLDPESLAMTSAFLAKSLKDLL